MAKLIFGCGYLGDRVARRWRDSGDSVVVVTRSSQRADAFDQQGCRSIIADVTRPETLARLPTAQTVLFAVGFDRRGKASIGQVYAGGLRNVLAALPPDAGRLIYISTTGVYRDADGGWVDEDTPPDPQRDGGRASLAAEQTLAEHPIGRRSLVLRLAGIYGPGRIPFLDKLRAGQPVPAPSAGWLNLIHVDDAAGVIVAAERMPPFDDGPRVLCVSDGRPVDRAAYYGEVARQIGAPAPTFVEPDPNSPRAARAAANRRVCNARMLDVLGVHLVYPDYRAGLAAILEKPEPTTDHPVRP